MSFVDILPERFRKSGYLAGGEAAWPKGEACRVIDYLTSVSLAVCGIEIWLPTDPGPTIPTPFIYTWEATPINQQESWSDFARRTNEQAKVYIRAFEWDKEDTEHKDMSPYFNLDIFVELQSVKNTK